MTGRIAKTLGFLGAFAAGVTGYQEANAQEMFRQVPNPNSILKSKITDLSKLNNYVITKAQYEALSPAMKARISPLYWGSADGKNIVPMYALPGFYDALSSTDNLFVKRDAQRPNGYFTSDSMNGRRPVYLIEDGNSKFWYVGPLEAVQNVQEQTQKPATKPVKKKTLEHSRVIEAKPKPSKLEKDVKSLKEWAEEFDERLDNNERKDRVYGKRISELEEEIAKPDTSYRTPEDTTMRPFPSTKDTADSSRSQYGMPLDTTESFYRQTGDSLMLLEPFGKLTLDQKKEWNNLTANAVKNGFVRTDNGVYVRQVRETEEGLNFGPRAWTSNNNEVATEIFFNHPIYGDLRLGGFLGWSAKVGKNYFENQSLEHRIVTRDTLNISPTIRDMRVDETFNTNKVSTSALGEAGIELSHPITNYGGFSVGVGVKALREITDVNSMELSTITQQRNMVQIGQQVLTNNLPTSTTQKNRFVTSWRMMTYADLADWLKVFGIVSGVKDSQPNYGAGVQIDIGRLID